MASNFFEQQDEARKKTGLLVGLFVAAVIAIALLVYLVVVVLFVGIGAKQSAGGGGPAADPPYLAALIATFVGVAGLVGGCSLYKIVALRSGGGASVAQMMGGRLLHPDATEASERKILNIVEEMALASGTPVPPVYLMDREGGINAFAAGYAPESAVIGVTRGAVEQLSRDELQGVVAHEFSHILNGDMRLNIRLMGVIFGIIAIAVVGRVIMQSMFYSGGASRRSSKDNGGALAILAFGLALLVIGGVGVLFGRLIQAAVSRQREYLADAAAVQFTRNPDSIGGALKRIGGFGSSVKSSHAEEAGHMFIAKHGSAWAVGLFATHPPIEDRIKRVDPAWDGSYPQPRVEPARDRRSKPDKRPSPIPIAGEAGNPLGGIVGAAVTGAAVADAVQGRPAQPAIEDIGRITPAHLAYMRELLASIPAALKTAAHEPYGARAVVYAVLLDSAPEVQNKQLEHLAQHADGQVLKLTRGFIQAACQLPKEARLPLIDMAVPALRELSDQQYADFTQNVTALIEADGRVDLFEWTLERLLLRHLDAHFHPAPDPQVRYYSLKPVADPCATLLSALAHIGHRDAGEAARAFTAGSGALGVEGLSLKGREQVKYSHIAKAIDDLKHISPREKKKLVTGCALTIAADGEVTRGEGELMRAVADSLGVPMPPLMPGQKLV